jgi:hypothetical protein
MANRNSPQELCGENTSLLTLHSPEWLINQNNRDNGKIVAFLVSPIPLPGTIIADVNIT